MAAVGAFGGMCMRMSCPDANAGMCTSGAVVTGTDQSALAFNKRSCASVEQTRVHTETCASFRSCDACLLHGCAGWSVAAGSAAATVHTACRSNCALGGDGCYDDDFVTSDKVAVGAVVCPAALSLGGVDTVKPTGGGGGDKKSDSPVTSTVIVVIVITCAVALVAAFAVHAWFRSRAAAAKHIALLRDVDVM
jgi:hypothetical protein